MAERFIVDDAGTLIDLVSRDTYDYVSDVCPVLNKLVKENEKLKQQLADIDRLIYDLGHDEMRRQYEEIFKGDVE